MGIKIRFMRADEVDRVAELIKDLQVYQQLENVKRIPTGEDLRNEIVHKDEESGCMLPNNFGVYVVIAVDDSKLDEPNQAYIVGYIMYQQSFSIIAGKQIYMTSFFIEPQYRRLGVGRQLVEFMRIHALSTGSKRIDVPFMNKNLVGQKFYANYGSYLVNEEYQLLAFEANKVH